jgi:hypothetical protein
VLSTIELVIYGFLVLVLLPIIVQQLLAGSPPSQGGPLRKYQLAEPRLNIVGNVFVLSVCILAVERLAQHFGLIAPDLAARLEAWTQVPFFALFLGYIALWIKALITLGRGTASK